MAQTIRNASPNLVFNSRFRVAADMVTAFVFTADRPYNVKGAKWIHGTAEATAPTLVIDVTKDTGTGSAGGGSSVLSGTFNAKSTANTVQSVTSTATLAAGERLSILPSASATELAGGLLSLILQAA